MRFQKYMELEDIFIFKFIFYLHFMKKKNREQTCIQKVSDETIL